MKCCSNQLNTKNKKITFYIVEDVMQTGVDANPQRIETILFDEWAEIKTSKGEQIFDANNVAIEIKTTIFVVKWNSNTIQLNLNHRVKYTNGVQDFKFAIDSIMQKDLNKGDIFIYCHQIQDF